MKRAGGGDAEHRRAGADVKNAFRLPCPFQTLERPQTAERGAVMTGAEGERGLDLQSDPVRRDPVAIVAAVDHEPPRIHRRQARTIITLFGIRSVSLSILYENKTFSPLFVDFVSSVILSLGIPFSKATSRYFSASEFVPQSVF